MYSRVLRHIKPKDLRETISLRFTDILNPVFWIGDSLKPEVNEKLMQFAEAFVAFVDMDKDNANQIEGNIPISITMTDKAGNVANEVTQANVVLEDATLTVTYDKTIPALTAVTYENITGTAPNPQTHATTDDQIRLSIVANDDLYYHATDNGGPWPKIKISKRLSLIHI